MAKSKSNTFAYFLEITSGQKEVGLAIAKNNAELALMQKELSKKGFKKVENVFDLFKSAKAFFIVGEKMEKDFYDTLVQYPTGQVEIFNKQTMRQQIFTPDYHNAAIVCVVAKGNLSKLRKRGFDLLSVVGPAFQY